MSPLYPVRSRHLAARMFEGEMMIMSSKDSTLFNLDDVGSVIWAAADGRTSLEEIVADKVCTQFDTTPEVAFPDAESFVRELAALGILELPEAPIEEVNQSPVASNQSPVKSEPTAGSREQGGK
ncbi:MAG: PqqD family protein [Terriglobales bacterium]|jgi:hypothetical protein